MTEKERIHQDATKIINDFENEEVIVIFWLGGYDYVVYTDVGGYVYNF